jgi:hypothetical protein
VDPAANKTIQQLIRMQLPALTNFINRREDSCYSNAQLKSAACGFIEFHSPAGSKPGASILELLRLVYLKIKRQTRFRICPKTVKSTSPKQVMLKANREL